jgi:hypothetical protein
VKENATNEFARNFLSVIAGVLTAIAAGALLIPIVRILVDKFFNLYLFSTPPPDAWKNDLILVIILFAWLFIASLVGGFVCALVSINKDILHVLISSLVSIVLAFIASNGEIFIDKRLLPYLLILLGIPLGNLLGGWIGGRVKRKKPIQKS